MTTSILTQDRLRDLLSYDPDTGLFHWRRTWGNAHQGAVAGSVNARGYRMISVDAKIYGAHRLAWLYTHGVWPNPEIDHINRQRSDNRLANLRVADRRINNQNTELRKSNSSGFRGVTWHSRRNAWQVRISANGAIHALGYFDDLTTAAQAYATAAKALHPHRVI
jgi:hypothetical protein